MLFCFLTSAKGKTEGLLSPSECVLFSSSSVSPSPCLILPTLSDLAQPSPGERCVLLSWSCIVHRGTEMTNLKQLLPSAGSLVAEVEQDMKQHFNKHSMKKKIHSDSYSLLWDVTISFLSSVIKFPRIDIVLILLLIYFLHTLLSVLP